MRQSSFAEIHCSLARTLEVVGDWWSPLIVRDVFLGVDRFSDLVDDLGLSRNLLTRRLDHLVEHGILRREQYQARPRRDRYRLTDAGRELVPVLLALTAWGDRWQTPPGGPPMRFRHRDHPAEPVVACGTCGEAVTAGQVDVVPGPGGRRAPGTMVVAERLAARRRGEGERPTGSVGSIP